MTASEILAALSDAAASGDEYAITRTDGKAFVGVIVPTDVYGEFRLQTGKRGRPPVLSAENVAEISPAA